jgi:hypothetical protein
VYNAHKSRKSEDVFWETSLIQTSSRLNDIRAVPKLQRVMQKWVR